MEVSQRRVTRFLSFQPNFPELCKLYLDSVGLYANYREGVTRDSSIYG